MIMTRKRPDVHLMVFDAERSLLGTEQMVAV
jgi:hypothetical protein